MIENFKAQYQAEAGNTIASDELIHEYKDKVPDLLIDIWKTTGLGKYNSGIIELVNPKDYEPNLWTWLGREVPNYVPIAITGFGELMYYRKLTETNEDVCFIDIQYRRIETVEWSLESFFEGFLIDEEIKESWLREELFNQAIAKHGKLQRSEVFTFVPILAFGGGEEVENVQKGNAQVYLDLVFQMTS